MSLRDETGKFTKAQSYYVDDTMFGHSFKCANCFHYDAENSKCTIVSEEGEPGDGYIAAGGACSLFNARPARIEALQLLWGRADSQGLAPEKVRATSFMFSYSFLDVEPPEELRENSLIDYQTAQRIAKGRASRKLAGLRSNA
jgi:hypothetical protein